MIPAFWNEERECFSANSLTPAVKAKHKNHKTVVDCYRATWLEPPLPWFRRAVPGTDSFHHRMWHLIVGIRIDDGTGQAWCNVGSGPGPFQWRDKPTLNWREEPGQWFCRRCVAAWTEGVHSVTVRVDSITVRKGQLAKLLEKIDGTDLMEVRLRQTAVENQPALIAEWDSGSSRDKVQKRVLLVGNGVVDL